MDIQELKKNGLPLLRGLLAPPAFPGPKATLVRLALMVLRVKKAILAKQVPPVQMALKDPPALMVLPDRKATQVIQARLARLVKQVHLVQILLFLVLRVKSAQLDRKAIQVMLVLKESRGKLALKALLVQTVLPAQRAILANQAPLVLLDRKASRVRLVPKVQLAQTDLKAQLVLMARLELLVLTPLSLARKVIQALLELTVRPALKVILGKLDLKEFKVKLVPLEQRVTLDLLVLTALKAQLAQRAILAKQVPPVRMVFKAQRVTLVTPAPLAQIPQYLGRKVQKATPAPPALMVCKALWAPLGQMAQLVHKASKVRLVHKAQRELTALLLRQQFQPMPEIRPR
jgi:hypothetical protein